MSRKMFSKFTSILHSAVEALAPNLPQQQNFVGHWKAVTRYFIENKEHKVAIEHTQIPGHLEAMLRVLQEEEADLESGSTGPCMEYLLQHKILDTLYTLARTDCPPGMKQQVLVFFTSLMSKIRQPLLPHVNCHKAVHRLVRLCGEVKAAPTENEEIQFLCTVCAKLKMDPYLVNFFIEMPKNPESSPTKSPVFPMMTSLLNLIHSADARVAVKACEGLMLAVSLPEQSSANVIVQHTTFCRELTTQLCQLYAKLPTAMDPADIECVDANWGLDHMSGDEDHLNFAGKRALLSFLSWFDYCDQLVTVAHPDIAAAFAESIRREFLEGVLEPLILQANEAAATTATAHLCRCLRAVTSPILLSAFVHYILGDERTPESPTASKGVSHKLRERLIERCDHLSEEMSITSLKLFETMLLKPDEHIIHNLVLRNLLGRGYLRSSSASSASCSPAHKTRKRRTTAGSTGSGKDTAENGRLDGGDNKGDAVENRTEDTDVKTDDTTGSKTEEAESKTDDTTGSKTEEAESKTDDTTGSKTKEVESKAENEQGDTPENKDVCDSPADAADYNDLDDAADFTDSTPSSSPRGTPSVHTVVNSFLGLVPDEAKSSYQSADSEYDTYLRDARRQFSDVCTHCSSWGWPTDAACDDKYVTDESADGFHEGAFLSVILDKMSRMLDQSYDVNLQVTSVVSRLAMLPHPNLHEYMLNPLLSTRPGVRTLTSVIKKVAHDVETRMTQSPDFARHLSSVRQQLMGMADNIRRAKGRDPNTCVDDSYLLEGVIVLEEFCKELAAIACVKYYAASSL